MFRPPRGTRDYLPEDMAIRREVIEKFRRVFELYGYGEVLTPAFEYLELLEAKAGPEVKEQIYWFKDKAGRKLGLRFELTTPIARIIASRPDLPKPIRFYYIAPVWRYEEPQKGRLREFWHAGIELIGSSKVYADAEVIAVMYRALREVGLQNVIIRINDRLLAEALARKVGLKPPFDDYFRILDKLDKQGIDGVKQLLKDFGLDSEKIELTIDFITLSGTNEEKLENAMKLLGDEIKSSIDRLNKLLDLLRGSYNIPENALVIDFSIVRGLAYYTSLVFEATVPDVKEIGSVAGGGRYDNLIELVGGPKLPATGMAIGVERVIEALMIKGIVKKKNVNSDKVLVVPVNQEVYNQSVSIAELLRSHGISCEIDVLGRKLGTLLEYADKLGMRFAVIVGKRELAEKKVVVRNLVERRQEVVKIDELASYLKKLLS